MKTFNQLSLPADTIGCYTLISILVILIMWIVSGFPSDPRSLLAVTYLFELL